MPDPPSHINHHLAIARTLTRLLDDLVRVPGTQMRFGLDPLISLLPGVGDATGAALSGYMLIIAARVGAPPSVLVRMFGNVLLDMLVGTIPTLGDLFDVGWKANSKNIVLLEQYLLAPQPVHAASRVVVGLMLLALVGVVLAAVALAGLVLHLLARAFTALSHSLQRSSQSGTL
jgi:hypothetical protein